MPQFGSWLCVRPVICTKICRVIQTKRQVQSFLGNFLYGVADSETVGKRISGSRNLFDELKLTREVTFQSLGQPGAMRSI